MYKLFFSPGACSLAVHIVLEEIGANFTLEEVSVARGETAKEPFLAVNPKGRVPALMIAGEPKVLTELQAILLYLRRRHHGLECFHIQDPLLEARLEEWLSWLSGWVHGVGFALLWRPGRFSPDSSHHNALIAHGRGVLELAFRDIEKHLADRHTWMLGEVFSVVDPYLLVLYRWGNRIGEPMRDLYPHWTTHTGRMLERPAVLRALRTEGIAIEI